MYMYMYVFNGIQGNIQKGMEFILICILNSFKNWLLFLPVIFRIFLDCG